MSNSTSLGGWALECNTNMQCRHSLAIRRIWLTDLSALLPETTQLDGLDISFDATAPQEWLPPNVTLRHFDVKGEVPPHMVGCYDMLHIRNFAFVLLDVEVPQVLENLVKLLSE